MIYDGTDLKFKIIPQSELANLQEQDFHIIVKNKWGQILYGVAKGDCFEDEDGNFYFCLECVKRNVLHAYFKTWVDDDDYEKGSRTFTDQQYLCTVGACECGKSKPSSCQCDCECEHHIVSYMQVWTVNVEGKSYLVGSDGAFILTSDGKKIEFKK